MEKWIELLINSGIGSGVIAGIVVAIVEILVTHLEHTYMIKNRKAEQNYKFIEWQRDEIQKLIIEVSEIRIPDITETNEVIIENTYHLIIADYDRAKALLYSKNDVVIIKGFFNTLNGRYNQMKDIKSGVEKELKLDDSKRVLIGELTECKQRLLDALQNKEKEIMGKWL